MMSKNYFLLTGSRLFGHSRLCHSLHRSEYASAMNAPTKNKLISNVTMPRMKLQCAVLLFCLVLNRGNVAAQSAIDTSYHTTYYVQKTTLFSRLPLTKKSIIFLGDSITDIGEWAELWQNSNVKNRGISGDNTFGVLARLHEITAAQPAKIFIMIGINDIARNTPDSIIVANYEKLVRTIKLASPKTKLYIQSILPTNNTFTEFVRHQNKDAQIGFVNSALAKLATANNAVYIDLYTQFLDASGQMSSQYSNDGLHLDGNGYQLWKNILQQQGTMR